MVIRDMIRGLVMLGCAFVLVACSAPQQPSENEQPREETKTETTLMQCFERAGEATKAEDWVTVRDAYGVGMDIAPDVPALIFATAAVEARLGNLETSLTHLRALNRLGATADLEAEEGFAQVLEEPEFRALADQLHANGSPQPEADITHRMTDAEFWPEGIAIDDSTGDLYLGSIEHRTVFRFSIDGSMTELTALTQEGLMEVLGVWVDAERHTLWAATGEGEYEEPLAGPPRKNELICFDLQTNQLVQRYAVPDDELRLLNDVVVGPDGTAWATETVRGELFRVAPGGEIELYRRFPEVIYLNGITISGDGETLYLGHYDGLTAIDLVDGTAHPVRGSDMALGMIDGLSWIDNQLVMVQNSPRVNFRVVRVALDATGRHAEKLEVLPSGVPEGLIPYTCAVSPDTAYVVAGPPFGLRDEDITPPAPAIVAMPLSPSPA